MMLRPAAMRSNAIFFYVTALRCLVWMRPGCIRRERPPDLPHQQRQPAGTGSCTCYC